MCISWNQPGELPSFVDGWTNDEVWMLIRRFNMTEKPLDFDGKLDLNRADHVKAVLERGYIEIVTPLMHLGGRIVYLRSWEDFYLTLTHALFFAIAWLLDHLITAYTLTLFVLILVPSVRPMAYAGAAAESEAEAVVDSIAAVAVGSVTGKGAADNNPGGDTEMVPDPEKALTQGTHARKKAERAAQVGETVNPDGGLEEEGKLDTETEARQKVEKGIWDSMDVVIAVMQDVIDTWERFGNALSPKPPFSQFPFISSQALVKGTTLLSGAIFFSQPVIMKPVEYLNKHYPHWTRWLELRNSILKGIPTNAQVAITLLRTAEQANAPLPPPPSVTGKATTPSDEMTTPPPTQDNDQRLDSTADTASHETHSKGSRLLSTFKSITKGGVNTTLTADHLKADLGSDASKNRLGVVPGNQEVRKARLKDGPSLYACRYKGKKGNLVINTQATTPSIAFRRAEEKPVWTAMLDEVKAVKKVGGLGWKSKLLVGYLLGYEVVDGLSIETESGDNWIVTALTRRDEAFNRLVAMGNQRWETL
ncbi:hypothetical protein BT69DRAFT_1314422 [Atractiella rhizophila]|nr:hypothetical protein BT69DRAFT_1314422 [Atractiella rhizophila]